MSYCPVCRKRHAGLKRNMRIPTIEHGFRRENIGKSLFETLNKASVFSRENSIKGINDQTKCIHHYR